MKTNSKQDNLDAIQLRLLKNLIVKKFIEQFEALKSERRQTVSILRQMCDEHGDNDWPDDLHLADVLEKHLWRHLEDNSND